MTDYLCFEQALGEEANRALYELAIGKRELFTHSRTSPNRLHPDWRKSKVIYHSDLADFAARIEREVRSRLTGALSSLDIPAFDVGTTEVQLTSHNDGEYYHWHTDNGSLATRTRAVTFVYYFHGTPKPFTGGELVIYGSGGRSVVEPRNDALILFSSGLKHEVLPVLCASRRFEDGRFTLNGWVRRRVVGRDDYFDGKIFAPPRRTMTIAATTTAAITATTATATSATPAAIARRPAVLSGESPQTAEAWASAPALLDLYSRLHRESPRAGAVDMHRSLSGDEFYQRYYSANRPVLIKGAMADSRAVRSWTPAYFATHHGEVAVTVTADRDRDPDYEANFAETVRTMTLGELVARIAAEPESNDYYLVARNFFFDQPALTPLRRDLQPPPDIVDLDRSGQGSMKLWLGPKGTVTPLHHDEHSILFAQIHGRKAFKLIAPFDSPSLYVRRRYYSAVDPEHVDLERYPAFADATVSDVVIEPGDLLFLPVGWWHWVRALDISISATFSSFHVPGRNTLLHTPC